MTKQDLIQKAYGKHWDIVKEFVDENGNCLSIKYEGDKEIKNHPCLNDLGIYKEQNFAHVWYDPNLNAHLWRQISLDGIEDNNGWIKLESDDDLPKDTEVMYFYCQRGNFANRATSAMDLGASYRFYKDTNSEITHYKVVKKPEEPFF